MFFSASFKVAPKYQTARKRFIICGVDVKANWTKVGGMTHAHLPISYYLIAKNLKCF